MVGRAHWIGGPAGLASDANGDLGGRPGGDGIQWRSDPAERNDFIVRDSGAAGAIDDSDLLTVGPVNDLGRLVVPNGEARLNVDCGG